jgi:lysozyme
MSPESLKSLKDLLVKHEGVRLYPYQDTTGHWTIGIGRNLTDSGLYQNEPYMMLDNDINYFTSKLESILPYFNKLDEVRKIVLVDMCFNLGIKGLLKFKDMLDAIRKKDWERAAKEIIDSLASKQTKNRYAELASMMKTGVFPNRVN